MMVDKPLTCLVKLLAIFSIATVSTAIYSDEINIKGDCNVVAPHVENNRTSFTVNCSNIDPQTQSKIDDILNSISMVLELSRDKSEVDEKLSDLLKSSKIVIQSLEAMKSPELVLITSEFQHSYPGHFRFDRGTLQFLEIANIGGPILTMDVDVIALAKFEIDSRRSDGPCPVLYYPGDSQDQKIHYRWSYVKKSNIEPDLTTSVIDTSNPNNHIAYRLDIANLYRETQYASEQINENHDIPEDCFRIAPYIGIKVTTIGSTGNVNSWYFSGYVQDVEGIYEFRDVNLGEHDESDKEKYKALVSAYDSAYPYPKNDYVGWGWVEYFFEHYVLNNSDDWRSSIVW